MAREAIPLPRFGEGVATAELVAWLVEAGQPVKRGEDIAEVQTAKAVLTVAAPADGVLAEHSVEPGTEVEVGELIGYLETAAEAPAESTERPASSPSAAATRSPAPSSAAAHVAAASGPTTRTAAAGGGSFVSPRVRARMDELGLSPNDLAAVPGTGRNGRVTAEDLDAWLDELAGMDLQPASPMRRAVADAMRRSWARPLATVARSFSLDALLDHRRTVPGRPSLTLYAARALALALAKNNRCARRLVGSRIAAPTSYHIAIAAEAEDGILLPLQLNADRTSLADIAAGHAQALSEGPHSRGERATATVTNYGSLNLNWATPIPPPDQSAILGVGKPEIVPVWDPGTKAWGRGKACELTLTFDHRVADGADAASLLHAIAKLLEHPTELE